MILLTLLLTDGRELSGTYGPEGARLRLNKAIDSGKLKDFGVRWISGD